MIWQLNNFIPFVAFVILNLFLPNDFKTLVLAFQSEAVCRKHFPADYEENKAPNDGEAVKVFIRFQVIDIDEINEETMDFRLHTYFTMIWNDTRLKDDESFIFNDECRMFFWIPEVVFEKVKFVYNYGSKNINFKFMDDGSFFMTERFSFKVSCFMNFASFPFDSQQCLFTTVFMSDPDSVAVLKWINEDGSPLRKEEPVKLLRAVQPLQFYLKTPTTHFLTETFFDEYTYLIINFTLVRRLTGSIVGTYAPSSLIVMMSWVTFWLNIEAAPARVALSVTSLLTLCTQVHQYKSQLPPINYLTAMDIWMFMCILLVFATLIEFAVAYSTFTREKSSNNSQMHERDKYMKPKKNELRAWSEVEEKTSDKRNECMHLSAYSIQFDIHCRKIFPIFFAVFITIYWSYYLSIYNTM